MLKANTKAGLLFHHGNLQDSEIF